MRLRTLLGPSAGEVRDYAYVAGVAAVQAGTAAPVDAVIKPVAVGVSERRSTARVMPSAVPARDARLLRRRA